MPYAATTGTASCAMFSIGWFKSHKPEDNEAYKNGTSKYKPKQSGDGSLSWFSGCILGPTSQPIGKTDDMPLECLMKEIERVGLNKKMVLATLNNSQFMAHDGYWPKELKRWGFVLVDKVKNDWGSVNYLFIRNPSRVEIQNGEA